MIKLTDLLNEQESFTATSKKSGETAVFKTKDARDAAVKAGTHSKIKDKKDGDSKKDTPKVNIFKRDSDSDSKKNLQKMKKDREEKEFNSLYAADDFQDTVDDLEGKISDEDYQEIKDNLEGLANLQIDLEDIDRDEDNEEWGMQQDIIDAEVDDLKGLIKQAISKSSDSKDKPKKKIPNKFPTKKIPDNDYSYQNEPKKEKSSEPSKFDIEDVQDFTDVGDIIKNNSNLSKQQISKLKQLSADWEDAEGDMQAGGSDDDYQEKVGDIRADVEDILSSKEDEPKSEPSKPRPGNPQVNKSVRKKAQDLGITPQKLGKEEYESKMSKAAVEALTDSNFHSEARKLISILEDNPEFAKNPNNDPNKPKDMFSPEYDEWRKNSVFSSEFYDSDDDIDKVAHMASNESGWEGKTAADAIAFDLKMNGSHKLAAKIQSIFNEKNESSTSLRDLLPESVINEGTRSQVGVIGRNGKIVSAYVHYDGYPSNMKPGLKKHMKSDKDVLKLIKMGGARGIFDDKEIEYYKSGKPMKGDSKDIAGYIKDADSKNSAEFVYLYNMKDKKWYYADTYKDSKLKKLF